MKLNKLLVVALGMGVGVSSMAAANNATVSVSATVSAACQFVTATGSVSFTLDPTSGAAATGTVSQPTFWCTKNDAYTISDDNGINKSGTTYQMKDSSGNTIPYSFSYTKTGKGNGKTSPITMDISASVANADYVNAPAGTTYADTVTLTVNP